MVAVCKLWAGRLPLNSEQLFEASSPFAPALVNATYCWTGINELRKHITSTVPLVWVLNAIFHLYMDDTHLPFTGTGPLQQCCFALAYINHSHFCEHLESCAVTTDIFFPSIATSTNSGMCYCVTCEMCVKNT